MRRPRNANVLKIFLAPKCVDKVCVYWCTLTVRAAIIIIIIYSALCRGRSACGTCASIKISYHYRKGNRHPKLGSKSDPPHGDKARQMDRILTCNSHEQSAPTLALYWPPALLLLLLPLSLRMCPERGAHSAGVACNTRLPSLLCACCNSTSLS